MILSMKICYQCLLIHFFILSSCCTGEESWCLRFWWERTQALGGIAAFRNSMLIAYNLDRFVHKRQSQTPLTSFAISYFRLTIRHALRTCATLYFGRVCLHFFLQVIYTADLEKYRSKISDYVFEKVPVHFKICNIWKGTWRVPYISTVMSISLCFTNIQCGASFFCAAHRQGNLRESLSLCAP